MKIYFSYGMAMAVVSAWQLALDCCAICFYILSCVKKVQTVRGHPSQVIKVLSMVKPNCYAKYGCSLQHFSRAVKILHAVNLRAVKVLL